MEQIPFSSIFAINSACQIKTNNVEMQALKVISSRKIINYIPSSNVSFNISSEIFNMEKLIGFEIPEIKIPQIVNFGEKHKLGEISKNFLDLKNLEQQLLKQTTPLLLKENISFLSKLLIIISIIITSLIIIKIVYKIWQRRNLHENLNNATKQIFIASNIPLLSNSPPIIHSSLCKPKTYDPIYPNIEHKKPLFPQPTKRHTLTILDKTIPTIADGNP